MLLSCPFPCRVRYAAWLLLLLAAMPYAQAAPKIPMVAVMPLTSPDAGGSAATVVTDALADELLKTGQVRVMERAQMETILKEQGFSQSGACDGSECAVQVGKLLSIDRVIVGSLGQIGSSWSLSVRAVDVTTGEILGSSRRQ